jgi:hypothetical protein
MHSEDSPYRLSGKSSANELQVGYFGSSSFFGQMALLVYFCTHVFIPLKMSRGIRSGKEKIVRSAVFSVLFLGMLPQKALGQCAMCRAVVEQGGEEVAEGINSGIVYLMAFPYVIVAVASILFYRNWRRTAVSG